MVAIYEFFPLAENPLKINFPFLIAILMESGKCKVFFLVFTRKEMNRIDGEKEEVNEALSAEGRWNDYDL